MSEFLSDLGKGIASTAASGIINTGLGLLGQDLVNKQARENYKWQYDNFLSPKAHYYQRQQRDLIPQPS